MNVRALLTDVQLRDIALTNWCDKCVSTDEGYLTSKMVYPWIPLEVRVAGLVTEYKDECDEVARRALFSEEPKCGEKCFSGEVEEGAITVCLPHTEDCPARLAAIAQLGRDGFESLVWQWIRALYVEQGSWTPDGFQLDARFAPRLLDLLSSGGMDFSNVVGDVLDIVKADRKVRDRQILTGDLAGSEAAPEVRAKAAYKLRRAEARAKFARLRLQQKYNEWGR